MSNSNEHFQFTDERFADLQMLRYRLNGFEDLTLSQQIYIYCLAKATLMGRDITFDQQESTIFVSVRLWRLSISITMEIEHLMISRLSRFTSRESGSPAASTTIMVVKIQTGFFRAFLL